MQTEPTEQNKDADAERASHRERVARDVALRKKKRSIIAWAVSVGALAAGAIALAMK